MLHSHITLTLLRHLLLLPLLWFSLSALFLSKIIDIVGKTGHILLSLPACLVWRLKGVLIVRFCLPNILA